MDALMKTPGVSPEWDELDTLAFGYERTPEMWFAAHPMPSKYGDALHDGLNEDEVEALLERGRNGEQAVCRHAGALPERL